MPGVSELEEAPARPPTTRLDYVDLFRGLIMAHMALDHVSLFFNQARWAGEFASAEPAAPANLAQFLTRFSGVPVAPGFSFMAGFMVAVTTAGRQSRGVTPATITRRLMIRGLVLLGVEALLLGLPSLLKGEYHFEVLSCLGVSLILVALLRGVPGWALGAIALAVLGGHMAVPWEMAPEPLRWFLHEPHPEGAVRVLYPVFPWVGLMMLGHVVGRGSLRAGPVAGRWVAGALAALALFFVVRLLGGYGNAYAPAAFGTLRFWVFAKYPPDLAWLTWSLAWILLTLAALRSSPRLSSARILEPLRAFGRVPFFFYLVHFVVLFFAAIAVGRKFSLPVVFVLWGMLLALLVVPCAWYHRVKLARPNLVTRYL